MSVLDLRAAQRLYYGGAEASALYRGNRLLWRQDPVNTFPRDLMASGGAYAHFAVEDAGATWTARHGTPLTVERVGTPVMNEHGFLDMTAGCYRVLDPIFPNNVPLSLWCFMGHLYSDRPAFYIGPEINDGNQITLASVRGRIRTSNGTASFPEEAFPDSGISKTIEWVVPYPSTLSQTSVYVDGVNSGTPITNKDHSLSPIWDEIVIGADKSSTGEYRLGVPMEIKDFVMTVGWEMNSEQRAALQEYRMRRAA